MLNNGVKLLTNMLKCVRTVYLQEGEVTTAIELICASRHIPRETFRRQ